jgi:hypothetical protein
MSYLHLLRSQKKTIQKKPTRKEENRKRRKRGAGAFGNDMVEEAAESLKFLFTCAIDFDHSHTIPSG